MSKWECHVTIVTALMCKCHCADWPFILFSFYCPLKRGHMWPNPFDFSIFNWIIANHSKNASLVLLVKLSTICPERMKIKRSSKQAWKFPTEFSAKIDDLPSGFPFIFICPINETEHGFHVKINYKCIFRLNSFCWVQIVHLIFSDELDQLFQSTDLSLHYYSQLPKTLFCWFN